MSAPLTIGSTLWEFDQNHRVYGPNRGAPIYAKHFRETVITGETPLSWLVGPVQHKVNKRTLKRTRPGYGAVRYYTTEGKAEAIWEHENRPALLEKVRGATVAQLWAVAAVFEGEK